MVNKLTEILMFFLLSRGVSCSNGCCRRFGRIFGKCRVFERSNNILTETLSMISNYRHVEQSSNFTWTQLFDIGEPVVFLRNIESIRWIFNVYYLAEIPPPRIETSVHILPTTRLFSDTFRSYVLLSSGSEFVLLWSCSIKIVKIHNLDTAAGHVYVLGLKSGSRR